MIARLVEKINKIILHIFRCSIRGFQIEERGLSKIPEIRTISHVLITNINIHVQPSLAVMSLFVCIYKGSRVSLMIVVKCESKMSLNSH